MAAGDLITTDFQFEWGGILTGTGTKYLLQTVPRGLDLPDIRTADQARTRQHGETAGLDTLAGRNIEASYVVVGATSTELEQLLSAFVATVTVSETEAPLVWQRPNQGKRRANCRIRRLLYPVDIPFGMRQAHLSVQWKATDPLLYSNTLHQVATGREEPGAGITLPVTLPLTLPSSVSGVVDVVNVGSFSAPWTARLDGPLQFPTITHLESGRRLSLAFAANGGVDLTAGQWLDIDSSTRSVLLNGAADRRTQLTIDSDWWDLEPGSNSFQLTANSGAGTLTVSWRDAYLS